MSRRNRFALALPLLFLPLLGAAKDVAPPRYLAPDAIDVVALLPDPPSPGSLEHKEELALILKLQHDRTPADVTRVRSEQVLSVFTFADVLGPGFTMDRCPRTATFFYSVQADATHFGQTGKIRWNRPRPPAEPGVHPAIAETSPSYPSGHSTRATLFAELLAELVPDKRDALLQRGRDIGFGREIAGVHYPSDVLAGRTLGHAIAHALLVRPDIRATLADLKPELHAAFAAAKP